VVQAEDVRGVAGRDMAGIRIKKTEQKNPGKEHPEIF